MGFLKFAQQGKRDSNFISITASKSFGFGADFLRQNKLEDKQHVELYFDPDEKKIGFKFTGEKKDNNAFKLIKSDVSDSKSTVARSFFTAYLRDVDLNKYESKYKAEVVHDAEHGTLYVFKLKEIMQIQS